MEKERPPVFGMRQRGGQVVIHLLANVQQKTTLNFSQFVEGRSWWPWAREGRETAYVFAGDGPCAGEEIYRASAKFDALQTVIN